MSDDSDVSLLVLVVFTIESDDVFLCLTVIMPQMGVEYRLEPTDEQVKLYHKMIDWGADIIFGGHPHVVEPSEVVKKDGQ